MQNNNEYKNLFLKHEICRKSRKSFQKNISSDNLEDFFTKKFEDIEQNLSNSSSNNFIGDNSSNLLMRKKTKDNSLEFDKNKNEKNQIYKIKKNETKNLNHKKINYSVFKINKYLPSKINGSKKSKIPKNNQYQNNEINLSIDENKINKNFFESVDEFSNTKKNKKNKSSNSSDMDLLSELEFEENSENNLDESNSSELRVSAISKVNFSKLNNFEKEQRLKNLAKLVKGLKRKVRNLENRFSSNANKILNKYISDNLGIKKNNIKEEPLNLNIDNLCLALKNLRKYEKFEYDDQKQVIENFINLIAEEKIKPDSINFRKICTQIRLFLEKNKSNYISKSIQKITFSFPEKDVNITTNEYESYSNYKDREDIIRTILGVGEDFNNITYPKVINFEPKKLLDFEKKKKHF